MHIFSQFRVYWDFDSAYNMRFLFPFFVGASKKMIDRTALSIPAWSREHDFDVEHAFARDRRSTRLRTSKASLHIAWECYCGIPSEVGHCNIIVLFVTCMTPLHAILIKPYSYTTQLQYLLLNINTHSQCLVEIVTRVVEILVIKSLLLIVKGRRNIRIMYINFRCSSVTGSRVVK